MEGMIDSEDALRALCERLGRTDLIGIDTEFVRERTYYPQLCLVQVATDDVTACVDCLAGLDLGPFFEQLARPDVTWVLHSGRQDLEVVYQNAKVLPARLIDTQIAAALTGRAAQIGLREILASVLGIDIGKDHTRADWSARPLAAGPLRYALDDVRHLLTLWRTLERELETAGRLDWLAEDAARLVADAAREDLLPIWSRLKGVQGVSADEQRAALALVLWRERTAARLDRPRRWILSDELVARIAQLRPSTPLDLARIPEIPKRLAQRWGADIVAALESREDRAHLETLERAGSSERPDKDALKALQAEVKACALDLGIEAEVLASRRDLVAWLRGAAPQHLRSGWRAAALRGVSL
jgi:ribonuclease D